ncbi:hypothetical protein [Mycobacteroides abscessus]|uniref:hypothetical protein n=1 Tax=Mycobacteroides abscessus TaxID=36809 RepID=UPI00266BD2C7|nr:hypothetical protein [Mycobacteroides abscessus]MDO3331401.1 hypothetical protein [Mycobacteroides abscessus subsp. abscessus]
MNFTNSSEQAAGRTCPLCTNEPVEPVTMHGEQVCAECVSRCQICTGPMLIGSLICESCAQVHPDVATGRAA